MKLIFLDIDGVLTTAASISRTGYVLRPGKADVEKIGIAESHCIDNLNRLTDETGASFVISSAWRLNGIRRMRKYLREWGVKGAVIGVTPELNQLKNGRYVDVPRGFEVKHWLENAGKQHDVESFIAIDDDDDLEPFKDRLVWTDGAKGLTVGDVDYAIDLLSVPVEEEVA